MPNVDEPFFNSDEDETPRIQTPEPSLRDRIQELATGQPYAVLCTQGQGQPYGALVAFAFTEDLSKAVFATPVATRKYRLLCECDHVALVIDNRPQHIDDLMEVEAFTATGRAVLVERGPDFDCWGRLLVERHPYLKQFVAAPSCALFLVHIIRFLHVARFQEVNQWIP
jgi:hypothetical protein